MKLKGTICAIIFSAFCTTIAAQEAGGLLGTESKSEIGATGGFSYYVGDFRENFAPYMIRPSFGIFFRHNFDRYIALRLNIGGGSVQGDSRNYIGGLPGFASGYNLCFRRNYFEVSGLGEFNFMPFSSTDWQRRKIFTPYLVVGLGYALLGKNTIDNGTRISDAERIFPDMYDSSASGVNSLIIPMGFGFKISPAANWTVGIECIFKKTFIDNIDNFKNRHEGGFNIYNKDWITTVGITVGYKFGSSGLCPAYDTY